MPLVSPHLGGYCNKAIRTLLGAYVQGDVLASLRAAALEGERRGTTKPHGLHEHRQLVDPPNKNVDLRRQLSNYMQVGNPRR